MAINTLMKAINSPNLVIRTIVLSCPWVWLLSFPIMWNLCKFHSHDNDNHFPLEWRWDIKCYYIHTRWTKGLMILYQHTKIVMISPHNISLFQFCMLYLVREEQTEGIPISYSEHSWLVSYLNYIVYSIGIP